VTAVTPQPIAISNDNETTVRAVKFMRSDRSSCPEKRCNTAMKPMRKPTTLTRYNLFLQCTHFLRYPLPNLLSKLT